MENLLTIKDKFTQEVMSTMSYATDAEVEAAIVRGVNGAQLQKSFSPRERKEFLEKIRLGLIEDKEIFSQLIVKEAGKPIDMARGEVERGITLIEIAIGEMGRERGEKISTLFTPMNSPMKISTNTSTNFSTNTFMHHRQMGLVETFPLGLIFGITPFNFPLNLSLHKIIPAIAVGNSIIIKPSPHAPLTMMRFLDLCLRVGLPSGILQVVMMTHEQTHKTLSDDRIKMVSFTGSDHVGWHLKSQAHKKKVMLELGGNAAVIVDKSFPQERAVKELVYGAFAYAGQICISTQRIYIDEDIFENFCQDFARETEKLTLESRWGDPAQSGVVGGPIIDHKSAQRIDQWVNEALLDDKKLQGAYGTKILCGGKFLDGEKNLYAPTVIQNPPPNAKVITEEVFGPVVSLVKVKFFDEAISLINQSRYGLQGSLYTNQLHQIQYAFDHLELGTVLVNQIPGFRMDSMPYGGIKESGIGREGVRYAMEEMEEKKLLIW